MSSDLLPFAEQLALDAGALLLDRFREPAAGVGSKSTPTDLVSDADRASEDQIRRSIVEARPDDGILGEEGDTRESRSGLTWVVDPLDGTVNYLFGIPIWAVSIAAVDAEGPVAAVTYDPTRSETFSASRGGGAFLNGRPIRVGGCSDLSRALVGTGFAYDARVRERQAETVRRVLPRVRDVRRLGSATLDLAALACGRLDGFYEASLEPWDRTAGELLVTEAGGTFTDLRGPLGTSDGLVASNRDLHDRLRGLVE